MKKGLYSIWILIIALCSCKDDDINVFEKSADERVAEAIATLKADLVAPANGWRLKYRPESESGSFYVLMKFNDDNTVTIKSDLGADDGEYFEQTITYRIDNSLGLELVMESYSFFSYLFEQDAATFGAEYEFNFVNKTPDNALVFTSKTDFDVPTILLLEEAVATDVNLLGTELSTNLNIIANDLDKFSSSLKLTYQNKDLVLYLVLDDAKRILSINSASRKTNTLITQGLDFTSPYIIKGDSIVFDSRFTGTVLNNNISIKGIKLTVLSEGSLAICTDPIIVHSYDGITSANDVIKLETSLLDISGKTFEQASDFYVSPLSNVFNNGEPASASITQDITGALAMQLYYNYDLGNGTPFYGIGFYIQNTDGTATFALREFTPSLTDNNIVFAFEPEISIFGNTETDANTNNVNIYLDALTEGNKTYVFKLVDNVYEFYNPCTGWSFVFVNANQ